MKSNIDSGSSGDPSGLGSPVNTRPSPAWDDSEEDEAGQPIPAEELTGAMAGPDLSFDDNSSDHASASLGGLGDEISGDDDPSEVLARQCFRCSKRTQSDFEKFSDDARSFQNADNTNVKRPSAIHKYLTIFPSPILPTDHFPTFH
jgi:hypothetical protein